MKYKYYTPLENPVARCNSCNLDYLYMNLKKNQVVCLRCGGTVQRLRANDVIEHGQPVDAQGKV